MKDERQEKTVKKPTISWKHAWCLRRNSAEGAITSIHSWYIGVKRHLILLVIYSICNHEDQVGLLLLIAVAEWRARAFIALSTVKRKTYVCPPRANRSGWQAETLCVLCTTESFSSRFAATTRRVAGEATTGWANSARKMPVVKSKIGK